MHNGCGPECECRQDLDSALSAPELSARLLRSFIFNDSLDLIEMRMAKLKAAQIQLRGAMAAYRDHLVEAR